MSTFPLNTYLVGADGEYILHDENDPKSFIIVATQVIEIDYAAARSGQASRTRPVLSFAVKKDASDNWYLITNKQTLVGRYPSQSTAMGALYGCFLRYDGNPDSFITWLENCLSLGNSVIDVSENNIALRVEGNNLTSTISDITPSTIDPMSSSGFSYFHVIQLEPFTDSGTNVPRDFIQAGFLPVEGSDSITAVGAYENLAQEAEARSLVIQVDTATLGWVKTNIISNVIKKTQDAVIDFDLSQIDPAVLFDQATAQVVDNSTGVPNGVAFSYEWFRQTAVASGITLINNGDS